MQPKPAPHRPTQAAMRCLSRPISVLCIALCTAALPSLCRAQQQALGGMTSSPAAPAALRLSLTADTHMVFEPKPFRTVGQFDPTLPPLQSRVGLEFKSAAPAQGARNLLRVQLSGDSMLHFRPRAGGMQVTYKSHF